MTAPRTPSHERRRWSSPLSGVRSLKVRFSIIIVAAVVIAFLLTWLGFGLDWPFWVRPIVAVGLALAMVQVLAHGATSPLRAMMSATEAMGQGDYSQRVTATSADEVGRLAEAFNSMAGELSAVDQQRRDLVANVSHELRTPIAALRVNLENMVDGVTEPNQESLGVMLRQTERLGRLVTQLLDLARLESGDSPLDSANFGVLGLANRVAEELSMADPKPHIEIEVPPGLDVYGDAERLHQVLANLTENAVRYSPPGQPVRITARRFGGGVELGVADSGPGIPAEDRARVFDRFERVDEHRSTQKGGAGLGLAIVKWIIDLHGGTIEATDNAPGAKMVVRLPDGPNEKS